MIRKTVSTVLHAVDSINIFPSFDLFFNSCVAHPEAPLIEDCRAGDQICSACGLVVGDRSVVFHLTAFIIPSQSTSFDCSVIDVGSEWRTFSNEKANVDPSRVGAAENKLLDGADLSTIIGPPSGSASFDTNGGVKYQNRRTVRMEMLHLEFQCNSN